MERDNNWFKCTYSKFEEFWNKVVYFRNNMDEFLAMDKLKEDEKQINKSNKSNKSTKYSLHFPKTVVVDNNKYTIINKYVKKNYNTIVDLLYNKKLLKNKNSPYRIVYHIYVNYLNEDLNIIIK